MTYEKYRMVTKNGNVNLYNSINAAALTDTIKKIKIDEGCCTSEKFISGSIDDCLSKLGINGEIGDCKECSFYATDSVNFQLDYNNKFQSKVKEDSSYLEQIIRLVRNGKGEQEDIKKALLRLQTSSTKYSNYLLKQLQDGKGI
jgi:hypothetical protein